MSEEKSIGRFRQTENSPYIPSGTDCVISFMTSDESRSLALEVPSGVNYRDLPELGYRVVIGEVESHWVEFKAYRMDVGDFPWHDAENDEPTNDFSRAEVFLSGHVKWDGCSNWNFDAQESCMLHFCSVEMAENVGKLLRRLYELAAELMP